MKKIVSLLLCLAMTVLLLVSCGDDEIGSYRKNYDYEEPKVEEVTLEMYIVGDERNDGVVAVSRMINQYTIFPRRPIVKMSMPPWRKGNAWTFFSSTVPG